MDPKHRLILQLIIAEFFDHKQFHPIGALAQELLDADQPPRRALTTEDIEKLFDFEDKKALNETMKQNASLDELLHINEANLQDPVPAPTYNPDNVPEKLRLLAEAPPKSFRQQNCPECLCELSGGSCEICGWPTFRI